MTSPASQPDGPLALLAACLQRAAQEDGCQEASITAALLFGLCCSFRYPEYGRALWLQLPPAECEILERAVDEVVSRLPVEVVWP